MESLNPIQKLTRDLTKASSTLTDTEARYLVDYYYIMQDDRKRSNNQVRALTESGEPHVVIKHFAEQSETLESQIKRALDVYTQANELGQWARSVCGIGPVITAGLLANIDMEKAPTVGHIWRFAGLDPTVKWEKGGKRPWNASLKTLCWKIGESFVKVKGKDEDVYGKIYDQRKLYEQEKNAKGEYAEIAAKILKERPTHKQKAIYAEGRLPDGHIHARAKRYAVKLFLAHYHEMYYRLILKEQPPLPYAIGVMGHGHWIKAQ
jgi:pyridoxal/pyridoxine/pyridoxamine kinase